MASNFSHRGAITPTSFVASRTVVAIEAIGAVDFPARVTSVFIKARRTGRCLTAFTRCKSFILGGVRFEAIALFATNFPCDYHLTVLTSSSNSLPHVYSQKKLAKPSILALVALELLALCFRNRGQRSYMIYTGGSTELEVVREHLIFHQFQDMFSRQQGSDAEEERSVKRLQVRHRGRMFAGSYSTCFVYAMPGKPNIRIK